MMSHCVPRGQVVRNDVTQCATTSRSVPRCHTASYDVDVQRTRHTGISIDTHSCSDSTACKWLRIHKRLTARCCCCATIRSRHRHTTAHTEAVARTDRGQTVTTAEYSSTQNTEYRPRQEKCAILGDITHQMSRTATCIYAVLVHTQLSALARTSNFYKNGVM